jgi:uncharacterized protein (TIGR02996 family)
MILPPTESCEVPAMSQRESLLQAIRAEPDSDAVRLVFADWLEESGDDDRAAFVRAQCAAAGLPTWDAGRRLLLWQAQQLARRHPEWRQGLPELDGVTWGRFERGFLAEAVVANFATLTRHAEAIGRVGTVSAVVVLLPERSSSLAGLPRIPWLRSLVLDAERSRSHGARAMIYSDGTSALAEAPLLGTLQELRIDNHWPSDDALRALARSPHLRGLTSLSLNDTHGARGGWGELLASPNTRGLRRLSMRGPHGGVSVHPGFRVDVARIVAESANLSGLESLDVSNNSVDPTSYGILFGSPHLTGLRELTATHQFLDAEDLKPFASTRVKLRLKALDLSASLHREGLQHVLKAPCLAELERLALAECGLTGPDGESLAGARWRATLTALDLGDNRLQGAGLRRLFAADWPRLRLLRLAKTGLKAPALRELTGWDGLRRLGALDLSGQELAADAEKLLRQAGLPAEARLALGAEKARGDEGEEW